MNQEIIYLFLFDLEFFYYILVGKQSRRYGRRGGRGIYALSVSVENVNFVLKSKTDWKISFYDHD